jgi:hypothetical protein
MSRIGPTWSSTRRLYAQEKVHPKVLIDELMRQPKEAHSQESGAQTDLFASGHRPKLFAPLPGQLSLNISTFREFQNTEASVASFLFPRTRMTITLTAVVYPPPLVSRPQNGVTSGNFWIGYQRFVNEGLKGGHKEEYYAVEDQRFLGDGEFTESLRTEKEEEPSKPKGSRELDAAASSLADRALPCDSPIVRQLMAGPAQF